MKVYIVAYKNEMIETFENEEEAYEYAEEMNEGKEDPNEQAYVTEQEI